MGANIILGIEEASSGDACTPDDWCDHLYLKNSVCVRCGRTEMECREDVRARGHYNDHGAGMARNGDMTTDHDSEQDGLRRVALFGDRVRDEHNPTTEERNRRNHKLPAQDFPEKKK